MEHHVQDLRKILEKLQKYKLYAKASKCAICVQELDFVGHWITKNGIGPHRSKVQAITKWEPPKNIPELRSFIGMVSYYRKFIRNFAGMGAPLYQLLKKDVSWNWREEQQNAFEQLKQKMSEAPLLAMPQPKEKYYVVTDASDLALGAVLMQNNEQGMQPIAFWSRTLRETEKKYDAYDKEMLGIVSALQTWRHYLEGAPGGVEVWTDHQPATHLMKQKDLSRTQTRYLKKGYLQSIHPEIKYIKGKHNVEADALSRSSAVVGKVAGISTVQEDAKDVAEWIEQLKKDEHTGSIMRRLAAGESVKGYLLGEDGRLLRRQNDLPDRYVVPEDRQKELLTEFHNSSTRGHPGVERTKALLRRTYWWKRMAETVWEYVASCTICQAMKNETSKPKGLLQPIPVPDRKWQQVTTDLMTDLPKSGGYTAVVVFVDRLTKFCKFAPCTKEITAVQYAKLFFDNVFRNFGMPEAIISDRDPRFTSMFWKELFRLCGTKLKYSTAYHPQTDGQSEVTIRTLENLMRPYVEDNPQEWSKRITALEFAANNLPNKSTGNTPFFLMYGQHPRILEKPAETTRVYTAAETVEELRSTLETAKRHLGEAQERMRRTANKRRQEVEFEPGEKVLLSVKNLKLKSQKMIPSKIRRRFVGPFTILHKVSSVAYTLDLPESWRIHPTFHISKLKKFLSSEKFTSEKFLSEKPPVGELDPETGELEYEVEAIIGERRKGRRKEFEVKWLGYPSHENTWEPTNNLRNARELVEEFLQKKHKRAETTKA